jgi:hypothetical protein
VNARQLQAYAIEQALQHQNDIAPELMSYVGGDSKAAIDASIERAKQKTAQILAGIRQAQARPSDADQARFQADVQSGYGDQAPDVSGMTMADFAEYRKRAGIGQRVDHGIFGPVRN